MMTRFLAFAAAVIGSVVVLAQAPDYSAEGGKALDAKNYPAAVDLFTKAIAADPKDYTAHFNLALSYSLLDRYAEAVPEYKLTLELHPGLYDAQLNLGICLVRVKEAAAAIEPLKAAVEQKPKEFRPIYTLAQAQLALSDWANAESSFTQAIALNPASAAAEEGWGEALMRESKLVDAESHVRKAVAIDRGYKPALLQLGELYESANQPAQAIAIYREFPDNVGAQERMGVLLKQSGDAAAAISALEGVVAKSPTPANRVALAQAYVEAKDLAKAIPLVAAVVAATPDDYDLRLFYGRFLRDQRRLAEPGPQILGAAQKKPD
jgi:tetratricopeptide (TPR) repeat protein